MTFECRLQGEFDKILTVVDDKILSADPYIKKVSKSFINEPDYRSVAIVYNRKNTYGSVDINLVQVQTGSDINISVNTSADSVSDFNENDFINNIKSTVNIYALRSANEDVSETENKLEPLIVLISREYALYKDELLKSTYEHAGENIRGSSDEEQPRIIRRIKDALEKLGVKLNYRYSFVFAIYGFCVMMMTVTILFYTIELMVSSDYKLSGLEYVVFVAVLVVFLFGLMTVLGPAQKLFYKKMWNDEIYKFRGWYYEDANSTHYRVIRSESYNKMFLYENSMKIYLQGKLISLGYENMECIFETENWFVVMVDDNDIFSFAKCYMNAQEEELVRKILTPYYERRYKQVESEDSLFKDM